MAAAWNGYRFNPTAEILGWLYAYADGAPTGLIAAAEAGLRRTLGEVSVIEGAYDLKCAARFCAAPGAPPDLVAALDDLVRRSLAAHDAADEHLAPLEIAPTPADRFADAIADRREAALDALIAAQQPDGGWPVFWDWSFVDAKAWAKAKAEPRGDRDAAGV
jgi:hypothetical protein